MGSKGLTKFRTCEYAIYGHLYGQVKQNVEFLRQAYLEQESYTFMVIRGKFVFYPHLFSTFNQSYDLQATCLKSISQRSRPETELDE